MPNYIDIAFITERVDDNTLYIYTGEAGDATYDSTLINNSIDDAEAIVNSYIGLRYTVPLTGDDIINLVKRLTFDIAMYHISGNRGQNQAFADLYERYKAALEVLKSIRDGKMNLTGVTANSQSSALETIYSTSSTDGRHFSKDNFTDYKANDEWV